MGFLFSNVVVRETRTMEGDFSFQMLWFVKHEPWREKLNGKIFYSPTKLKLTV
jgi:hypothetical protein